MVKRMRFIGYGTIGIICAMALFMAGCATSAGPGGPTLSSITVASPSSSSLPVGFSLQLTANGTYSDSSNGLVSEPVWASSNPSVATISPSGLVTGLSAGTTSITAGLDSQTSSAINLQVVTAPALVSIALTTTAPATLGLAAAGTNLQAGYAQQFTATGTYAGGLTQDITSTVTWTSSNKAVATIAATGLATFTASSGTANITATFGGITSPSVTLTA